MTVLDAALPFFGFTVTVILHNPDFRPFSVVPNTLQYFAELATTFSDTFEVADTLSLANIAIDFAEAALDIVTLGGTKASESVGIVGVVVDITTTGMVVVADVGTTGTDDVVVEVVVVVLGTKTVGYDTTIGCPILATSKTRALANASS